MKERERVTAIYLLIYSEMEMFLNNIDSRRIAYDQRGSQYMDIKLSLNPITIIIIIQRVFETTKIER